ncbi:MAG TPA: radical SAM protein [Candidatus Acidoferrum sp.]|nr:radical SAM protein [Candidatus Acidoferrum sp.]
MPDRNAIAKMLETLEQCSVCPRECGADRTTDRLGYCRTGAGFAVSSICQHRGEEPVVSGTYGIVNVFFGHCNMQCVYCQNYQISRHDTTDDSAGRSVNDIVAEIEQRLAQGSTAVGFVSPSHVIPQMKVIMASLDARGHHPVYVYNTNGYDKKELIESLEGCIHVYLPDLKYLDNRLAREFSDTPDYVEVATAAIKEMFRQKGANIYTDAEDSLQFGLIIRHLVLPGQVENSKAVLRFIAEELSTDVHISLMSQYHPTPAVANHPTLGRTVRREEYEEVVAEFERLGFHRGWVQELNSPQSYRPDFSHRHPFEH